MSYEEDKCQMIARIEEAFKGITFPKDKIYENSICDLEEFINGRWRGRSWKEIPFEMIASNSYAIFVGTPAFFSMDTTGLYDTH